MVKCSDWIVERIGQLLREGVDTKAAIVLVKHRPKRKPAWEYAIRRSKTGVLEFTPRKLNSRAAT